MRTARNPLGPNFSEVPTTRMQQFVGLTPVAEAVLGGDGAIGPRREPFMPVGGFNMPYLIFGRSTPKSMIICTAFVLVFLFLFMLVYLFFAWSVLDNGDTQAYGVMNRSGPESCFAGTVFQDARMRCEVPTNVDSAIDPSIMIPTADPCSSVYIYAAGAWIGTPELDMRTFDSVRRTVSDTIPLLGTIVSRTVATTQLQDFVTSCIQTATHPNASSDAAFVSGMLAELSGVGMENHTALFRGAYALGRQFGMGISSIVSTRSAMNPRNTVESLLFWDVGTMIRQMAIASGATAQWTFEEGCKTLAFLGAMDSVIYMDWRDCAADMQNMMAQVFEIAHRTDADSEPITYDYIQNTLETRDLFTRGGLGKNVSAEFVNGYLTGLVASLSAFADTMYANGQAFPRVMGMRQWTMRSRYLADIAALIDSTAPARWMQFVSVLTVVYGMEVPLTLLHAPSSNQPQSSARRFLDISFNEKPSPKAPVVAMDRFGDKRHQQWISGLSDRRRALPTRAVEVPEEPAAGQTLALSDMMRTEMARACTLLALQHMEHAGDTSLRNILVSRSTMDSVSGMAESLREAFVNEIINSPAIPTEAKTPFALKMSEVAVVFGVPEDDINPFAASARPDASVLENIGATTRRAVAGDVFWAIENNGRTAPDRPAAVLRTESEAPSAYYDYTSNTVYVSTAMLTAPFFYSGWGLVDQYATLGFVIARSMALAIGTEGVHFSTSGSLAPIIMGKTLDAYNASILSLCRQYLGGALSCDGPTPDEVFADVTGMNVALRALEEVGGALNTKQLRQFVVAFAQTWASSRASSRRKTDHARGFFMSEARVDATASYMRTPEGVPVMSSAFECSARSRLLHEKPVEVS